MISNLLRVAALFYAVGLAMAMSDVVKADDDIRVMTFNIRYGTANDGENHWDKRKEFLLETIKAYGPDLLGTQETVGFQRDYLAEHLPEFGVLGVGRDDGKEKGEMMALYYKNDRFTKLDEGHFWLSESPQTAGSKSWDSSLPRMATWVKLRDQKQPSTPPILFLNTHFDHRGPQARLESAKLIREQLGVLGKGCTLIVTGDFNSGEGSPPYKALFAEADGQQSPVIDCYRKVHPERAKDEGTATAFKASQTGGSRIDWIGCSRDWQVVEAKINRTEREGRTPSDHFPVEVVLKR
ncbi:MAG TPA: endonuclease/exonuclease/phosphatase family protein [Pirellulaceae bacterium]|jgi:endonuclease/exonuclease/phosphatase family metal-dependent hydrolase